MDNVSKEKRSQTMRSVRSSDTGPERTVRTLLRRLGHTGYRLNRKDIAGKPDIAFIGKKLAIFVHGCFWHGHDCRSGNNIPRSNRDYWLPKLARNKERDQKNEKNLASQGWSILTIWECEIKNEELLLEKLKRFLAGKL